jgi:hypothetical protein
MLQTLIPVVLLLQALPLQLVSIQLLTSQLSLITFAAMHGYVLQGVAGSLTLRAHTAAFGTASKGPNREALRALRSTLRADAALLPLFVLLSQQRHAMLYANTLPLPPGQRSRPDPKLKDLASHSDGARAVLLQLLEYLGSVNAVAAVAECPLLDKLVEVKGGGLALLPAAAFALCRPLLYEALLKEWGLAQHSTNTSTAAITTATSANSDGAGAVQNGTANGTSK